MTPCAAGEKEDNKKFLALLPLGVEERSSSLYPTTRAVTDQVATINYKPFL
jgi:hypothetical protein